MFCNVEKVICKMKMMYFDVKSDKNQVDMMCFQVKNVNFNLVLFKIEKGMKRNDVDEGSFEVDFF